MARLKLANEERDAVLRAYTQNKTPDCLTSRSLDSAESETREDRQFSHKNCPNDPMPGSENSCSSHPIDRTTTSKSFGISTPMELGHHPQGTSSFSGISLHHNSSIQLNKSYSPKDEPGYHLPSSTFLNPSSSNSVSSLGTLTSTPRVAPIHKEQSRFIAQPLEFSTTLESISCRDTDGSIASFQSPNDRYCSGKEQLYNEKKTKKYPNALAAVRDNTVSDAFDVYSKMKERCHSNVLIDLGMERLGLNTGHESQAVTGTLQQLPVSQQEQLLRAISLPPGFVLRQVTLDQQTSATCKPNIVNAFRDHDYDTATQCPTVLWAIVPLGSDVASARDKSSSVHHSREGGSCDEVANLDLLPTKLQFCQVRSFFFFIQEHLFVISIFCFI